MKIKLLTYLLIGLLFLILGGIWTFKKFKFNSGFLVGQQNKMKNMINWETDNEDIIIVTSEATDLIHLENELTETIAKIIELKLFRRKFVEFYLDATNGSFFVYELDENKERTDDSKTVHFCALKIWEDYEDSNEFNSDMKTTLYKSIENLKNGKIEISFKIILIDELGDEEEI
ncbi:MAG: hypothetical protein IM631_02055 [Cytophagales bacterium]|jgi:hypothetical protein|nr:hypothetical protein [Cytophagales bacterium]MCA6370152.1 hypothetical protein [Cytophagales bacterium]MCA6375039.1 hypothetical protein [Cytophagales bacterium]